MKVDGLKKRILTPLALIMGILFCTYIFIFYLAQQKNMEKDFADDLKSLEESYLFLQEEHESWQMKAIIKTVMLNNEIRAAFAARDRELLLKLTEPLYQRLNSDYDVTHFYFTGPDRVNFLRVHSPDRYGDRIDRFTTFDAEKRKDGSWGLELGPLGTFTFRVVLPWYEGKRLIGYLELGKEIDHIVREMAKRLDFRIYPFIHKELLKREDWEIGMEMLDREADWNTFAHIVGIGEPLKGLPEEFLNVMTEDHHIPGYMSNRVELDGKHYRINLIPLVDAGKGEVGHMAFLQDISGEILAFRNSIISAALISFSIGATLFVVLYIFLGRIERRLSDSKRELVSNEEKYRTLLENLPQRIFLKDRNSTYISCNTNYASDLGISPDEIVGKDDYAFFPIELAEKYRGDDERISKTGEIEDIEEGYMLDGEERFIHIIKVPVQDKRGGNNVLGIFWDITEHKRAEEAIKMNEEKYRSLSEAIAELVYRADPETFIATYVNKSVESLYGYSVDEWLEDPSLWEKTIYPDDMERVIEVVEEAKRTQEGAQIEYRIKRKDGTVRWVEDRFTWEKNEVGKLISLDGLVYDITERKEMEEELLAAKRGAEEASQLKSDFLARMSHELRTPLNAIIGFSGVLLQGLDGEINEQQKEDLTYIANGGRHLLDLVNDILDIAKIEAKKIELEPINFKLRHSISDTINSLAQRASQNGVDLKYDIPRDLPDSLVGDPGRLRQILVNLIGNSIKFTEEGEIRLSLEVESEDGDDISLHFLVTDTGIGIPEEKLGHIFNEFEQADNSATRKYGGTGLGLSIARQLVELMEGRIWVESEVGKGSRFHFTARFRSVTEEVQGTGPADNKAILEEIHVLVVDDNASNCRLYKEMLKHWRMRPEVTESGKSALEMMSRGVEEGDPFQLLLLDRNMPEMDGFDLAGKIKEDSNLAASKMIMLTSSGLRGDAARCREVGISAYLSKPASPSTLLDTIMTVMTEPERPSLVTRHSLREGKASLNILFAEDNAVNRQLVIRYLKKKGHRVHIAVNGGEALAALEDDEKGPFQIILMDVQMPVMGGFAATAAIREKEVESGGHIPIIALTAHAMKGDREKCIEAGMDDYVSKPIDPDELFAAMDRVLSEAEKKGSKVNNSKEEDMDEKVLDKEGTLESFGGDADLLAEIIDVFLEETPKLLKEIHSAVSDGDACNLEHAAHSLKGSVSNFAAKQAIEAALRMEHAGREGRLETAEELYSSLEAEIERLVPELTAIVTDNQTA